MKKLVLLTILFSIIAMPAFAYEKHYIKTPTVEPQVIQNLTQMEKPTFTTPKVKNNTLTNAVLTEL